MLLLRLYPRHPHCFWAPLALVRAKASARWARKPKRPLVGQERRKAMRKFLGGAILAMGVGLLSLPGARAEDQGDSSTPPSSHVQQNQQAAPSQHQDLSKTRDQ